MLRRDVLVSRGVDIGDMVGSSEPTLTPEQEEAIKVSRARAQERKLKEKSSV